MHFSQAGGYSVLAINALGTVLSSNAELTVLPCEPDPSGLIDWWRAEGDATDSIGTNGGTLQGTAGFAPGEVGQAFSFDGSSGFVSIPDSPSLDSFSDSITIEAWIRSGKLTSNPGWEGLVCKGNSSWRLMGTSESSTVYVAFNGVSPNELFGTRNVNDEQWHHVAATYDGSTISIYVDGTLDVSEPASGSIIQTSDGLTIGDNAGQTGLFWNGLIDEVSLYNRALSVDEIAAIYAAGEGGKCFVPVPPSIITEPADAAVSVGNAAVFSVQAAGGQPLSYQWSFNGTEIPDATNSTLLLTNVQFNQAGPYSVFITNVSGFIGSTPAMLTVNPTLPCDPTPVGLVAWWRAEGDATDSIGTNNGALQGGADFAGGEVGTAFAFDGASGFVTIPDSPSLDTFSNAITIELWMKSSVLTVNPNNGAMVSKGGSSWELVTTSHSTTVTVGLGGVGGLTGQQNVNDGQWHHVAATYDGSSQSPYMWTASWIAPGPRRGPSFRTIHRLRSALIPERGSSTMDCWTKFLCMIGHCPRMKSPPSSPQDPAANVPDLNRRPSRENPRIKLYSKGSWLHFPCWWLGRRLFFYQWNLNGMDIRRALPMRC